MSLTHTCYLEEVGGVSLVTGVGCLTRTCYLEEVGRVSLTHTSCLEEVGGVSLTVTYFLPWRGR